MPGVEPMKKAAAEKKRRVCALCGGPISAEKRADSRFCSTRCRDKAFYREHTADKVKRVSRYQKANAAERRKFMKEYMRRYRAKSAN